MKGAPAPQLVNYGNRTDMPARIPWVKNDVYSLRLREDLYTLAQMRDGSIMQFFDLGNRDNAWNGTDLNNVPTLFYLVVAQNNLKSLFVEKIGTDIVMPSREPVQRHMLQVVLGNNGNHSAQLVELGDDFSIYLPKVLRDAVSPEHDLELIYRLEFTGMVGSEDKLQRRLLRWFDTGVNWDESKAIIFKNLPPPPSTRFVHRVRNTDVG